MSGLGRRGGMPARRRVRRRRALGVVWAFPNTLLGLGVAGLARATGGEVRRVAAVVEVSGGAAAWALRRMTRHGVAAMTLGHVVVGQDRTALDATRHHERVHVRQYARWGPFFLPLYALASLVAIARGRDAYRGNAFEVAAFAEDER